MPRYTAIATMPDGKKKTRSFTASNSEEAECEAECFFPGLKELDIVPW